MSASSKLCDGIYNNEKYVGRDCFEVATNKIDNKKVS